MFSRLFRRPVGDSEPGKAAAQSGALTAQAIRPLTNKVPVPEVAFYPPVDPGLPACNSAALIDANDVLVRRLRKAVSCDDAVFERRYMQPLRALARYVHLLPASAHSSFAGPGGLFRLCFEIAYFSAQAADERIYTPTADVETRHNLEPRYKYATFLAGLVCELHRPLSAAVICDASGGQWAKYLRPLEQWLEDGGLERYYVSWPETSRADLAGSEVSAVIGQIFPKEELDWLDAGSPLIVRDAFAVGLGKARAGESIIADVVGSIRARVLKVDEHTHPSRYGRLRVGHHIEMHLLDAMRTLVARKGWTAEKDSVLRYGTDGLYLLWPKASEDLQAEIVSRGLVGLPRDPLTIEELLGLAGLLVSGDSGKFIWTVVPGGLGSGTSATALRFKEPAVLLGYNKLAMEARPYAEYLAAQADGTERTSAAPTTQTTAPGKPSQPPVDQAAIEQAYSFAPEILASQPIEPSLPNAEQNEPPPAEDVESTQERRPAHAKRQVAPPAAENPAKRPEPRSQARAGQATGRDQGDDLFNDTPRPPVSGGISEAMRRLATPAEIEMMTTVRALHQAGRSEAVLALDDGSIAVAEEVVIDLDQDISMVVAGLQRRGWLGVCPNAARGARAAMISFGDKKKLGFVIAAAAAREMGLKQ